MPFGNWLLFELSMIRAVSQQLAARTTIFAVDGDFAACLLVDVRNAARQSVGPHQNLADHRASAEFEIAGLHGGEDVDAGRVEVRVHTAGTSALRAIVAGRSSVEWAASESLSATEYKEC